MERVTYRKTLDVHRNGTQFLLQGFETADNMSRVIEISLMESGDTYDFPIERITAMMYVTTPTAKEPSINACTIVDNKVVYEVLPITEEGITTMQLKLIETSPEGAKAVLASPKFAVEVTKSGMDDKAVKKTTTYTALEEAMAKAKIAYDERFLRMELSADCIFRAYYADGVLYETDVLKKLFYTGNVKLAESYAHGGTGVRAGEDTDNAKYYCNTARSEALRADSIMKDSEEILEEVKLHGMYTAFSVNFETGEAEYVSPSYEFSINLETGELEAKGKNHSFHPVIGEVVEEWLRERGVVLDDMQAISTRHTEEISSLQETAEAHAENLDTLNNEPRPIELGGTGATTAEEALVNLGVEPRLKETEWETIKVIEYSNTIGPKGNWETDNIFNDSIPLTDASIVGKYTQYRYILKKGSNFHVKLESISNRYTLGMNGQIIISFPHIGGTDLFYGIRCYAVRTGELVEESITLDEDIYIMPSNYTYSKVDGNKYLLGDLSTSYISINGGDIWQGSSENTHIYSTTAECSFALEFQGKR